ncbi:hypothetical protein [Sorangium sp. So ce233]|uniref:hypothetical protein n=1 Tax=Sorangium sp. So ce233 TaxID=3133290 RepID=UPI003F619553
MVGRPEGDRAAVHHHSGAVAERPSGASPGADAWPRSPKPAAIVACCARMRGQRDV